MTKIELSPIVVQMIIGSILPLLVGFLTKLTTKGKWKAWLLVFLNAVSALVSAAILEGGHYIITQQMALTALLGFLSSVGAYQGLWKAVGLTSSAIVVPGAEPNSVVHIPGALASVGVKE